MKRGNLGLGLTVALAVLIVTVGGVRAYDRVIATPDDTGTNGTWGMGSHMAPQLGMAGYASTDRVGPDACTGAWSNGMRGGGYNDMMEGSSGWGMADSGLCDLGSSDHSCSSASGTFW